MLYKVFLFIFLAMKLEYFDLVMLNCSQSPPPSVAEVVEGGEPPAEG